MTFLEALSAAMTSQEHLSDRQFNLFKQVPGESRSTVQAPLWAYANEITGHKNMNYLDYNEEVHSDVDDLRQEKLWDARWESHGKGSLYNDIAKNGIQKPVTINVYEGAGDKDAGAEVGEPHFMVRGGHHRLFTAEALDEEHPEGHKTMVPLRYSNETERHHGSW